MVLAHLTSLGTDDASIGVTVTSSLSPERHRCRTALGRGF
jgi:hypothetical protein